MSAGIAIEVNGVLTDLSEVNWYMKAPCGCCSGVTLGYLAPMGATDSGLRVITAEDAEREFHQSAAERKKYRDLGFTVFPDARNKVTEMLGKCEHTPPYGYERPPLPEGMTWASNTSARVLHLVNNASVATDDHKPDRSHLTSLSLCSQSGYGWSTRWYVTEGKVECKRCTVKGREATR